LRQLKALFTRFNTGGGKAQVLAVNAALARPDRSSLSSRLRAEVMIGRSVGMLGAEALLVDRHRAAIEQLGLASAETSTTWPGYVPTWKTGGKPHDELDVHTQSLMN
jgi:hypothetical protein